MGIFCVNIYNIFLALSTRLRVKLGCKPKFSFNSMKFGFQHPSFSYNYSNYQDTLKELALFAERTGIDSFWVMDHFHQISVVGKPYEPMLEGWTTISFLAAVTTKIRLGTLVTGVIYRHPSVLAKIGATRYFK